MSIGTLEFSDFKSTLKYPLASDLFSIEGINRVMLA